MENNMGIHVNCGSYRPKWLRKKRSRVAVYFCFNLEVPREKQEEAVAELSESVHELVSRWSRSCHVKLQKEEEKQKGGRKCQKQKQK